MAFGVQERMVSFKSGMMLPLLCGTFVSVSLSCWKRPLTLQS